MARRKQETLPELVFAMFRHVPWWVGPPLIVATYVILGWVIPSLIDVSQLQFDSSTPEKALGYGRQVLGKGLAGFFRMAAPWATLLVAGIWLFAILNKFVDAGRKAKQNTRQQKRGGIRQQRR